MFRQNGPHSLSQWDVEGHALPGARGAGGDGKAVESAPHGLPSFVSSAPPRSPGEALLRRIFSRGQV